MAEKNYDYILYHLHDEIGVITLNRPEKHNALQYPMIMEIIDVFESINGLINIFPIIYQ
ncbi:enoyl-CoA hydratase/isomerase family protein [Promethearchaeum syntrophicum]|uniref:Enoyl-CoA hydratase/isomerase family protein n=1 Tax=Promethearchaeum syntrophicum TaxID=2594042 RepID=A0AC61ZU33_9ARCH|nr:enoyl-CoA hydratase/isomerase family protein [Candidatus Prometheoarchaeum syntrophicum]